MSGEHMGWLVLTEQPDGTWKDDWDGDVHRDWIDALNEMSKATAALGVDGVRLVSLEDVTDRADTSASRSQSGSNGEQDA